MELHSLLYFSNLSSRRDAVFYYAFSRFQEVNSFAIFWISIFTIFLKREKLPLSHICLTDFSHCANSSSQTSLAFSRLAEYVSIFWKEVHEVSCILLPPRIVCHQRYGTNPPDAKLSGSCTNILGLFSPLFVNGNHFTNSVLHFKGNNLYLTARLTTELILYCAVYRALQMRKTKQSFLSRPLPCSPYMPSDL